MNTFTSLEEAERLSADAFHPEYSPPGEKIDRKLPSKIRFGLTSFAEFKLEDHSPYLVKGLLPRRGLVVVWGPPKCGKSFWAFDLLMHVALGWKYRGHRVVAGSIVYCALEGAEGFRKRIEAFRQEKLSEDDAAPPPPLYLMTTPLGLVADAEAFVRDIKAQLGETPPIAICIDTLNRSLAGSESSDEDMAAYIRAADAIQAAFNCLVVVIHHCGHDGNRPRGHSSLMGALDVQIAVRRDSADNVISELELSKDGDVGLQFVSRLRTVDVGVDQDGDSITSCVIEAIEGGAQPSARGDRAKRLSKAAQTTLRALSVASDALGEFRPLQTTSPRASEWSRSINGAPMPTSWAYRTPPILTRGAWRSSARMKLW
jgi:hypothetical protein